MSNLSTIKNDIEKPENIRFFLLETYGIDAEVILIKNRLAIKTDNYFSICTLIKKCNEDFDFEIYHKKRS